MKKRGGKSRPSGIFVGCRKDVDYGLYLSEKSQNGEDQMETDPPHNTDPEDLSKYRLDEYDNEPDKKSPYLARLALFFPFC